MKTNILIAGLISVIVLLAVLLGSSGLNSCSAGKNYGDTLSNAAHSAQNVIRDTITKYDTIKLKADIRYVKVHDTLWQKTPVEVDSIFNVTYPRDTADTTKFATGYTQLRKAIDEHNLRIRDSVKESATVAQVKTCTTQVSAVVDKIDDVKKEIEPVKEPFLTPIKVTIGALIIAFIAFVGGSASN